MKITIHVECDSNEEAQEVLAKLNGEETEAAAKVTKKASKKTSKKTASAETTQDVSPQAAPPAQAFPPVIAPPAPAAPAAAPTQAAPPAPAPTAPAAPVVAAPAPVAPSMPADQRAQYVNYLTQTINGLVTQTGDVNRVIAFCNGVMQAIGKPPMKVVDLDDNSLVKFYEIFEKNKPSFLAGNDQVVA